MESLNLFLTAVNVTTNVVRAWQETRSRRRDAADDKKAVDYDSHVRSVRPLLIERAKQAREGRLLRQNTSLPSDDRTVDDAVATVRMLVDRPAMSSDQLTLRLLRAVTEQVDAAEREAGAPAEVVQLDKDDRDA